MIILEQLYIKSGPAPLHLHPGDVEQLLHPVEQPLAHQNHAAFLILGVHADVDTNHHQNTAGKKIV